MILFCSVVTLQKQNGQYGEAFLFFMEKDPIHVSW